MQNLEEALENTYEGSPTTKAEENIQSLRKWSHNQSVSYATPNVARQFARNGNKSRWTSSPFIYEDGSCIIVSATKAVAFIPKNPLDTEEKNNNGVVWQHNIINEGKVLMAFYF